MRKITQHMQNLIFLLQFFLNVCSNNILATLRCDVLHSLTPPDSREKI